MHWNMAFGIALVVLASVLSADMASAQSGPGQEVTPMSSPDGSSSESEALTKVVTRGTHVYLLCIYGERSPAVIVRSCALKENALRQAYERPDSNPRMTVVRVNNPSKAQLENIRSHVGDKIAVVHVVAHSTHDETKPDGVDIWDCDMAPTDFAEVFSGSWVIWSGCFSRTICELADNILPTQCEIGLLHSDDENWKKLYTCLEQLGGAPADRMEICSKVWGTQWSEDVAPPPTSGPGSRPGQME